MLQIFCLPLSPPLSIYIISFFLESHSSLIPTAAHDIWVRGYLLRQTVCSGIRCTPSYGDDHLSVGSRLYLKQVFLFTMKNKEYSPTPVQSLRAYHGPENNIQALGSNPADCPIFRHYLLSQAIYDFTSPLSKETLGDTEALRVSQHQGVY